MNAQAFPAGGGEMGALMRAHDWSPSPLGCPDDWSPVLRSTVELMLAAEAQIVMFWGPEFVALYNDAYAPSIGDKHPDALGRPAVEHWGELWDDLEPLLAGVRDTGETFFAKDRPFYIERHGYGETGYWDVSYSAVRERDGSIGGVLCIVSETTERVRAAIAVRESEARYRALFGSLDSGFCIVEMKFDADGHAADYRFVEINPAFEQQTGLAGAEGKWMRDLAPAHEQHWFDLYGEVARTGRAVRFENRAEALGRWYDVHAFRIDDPAKGRVAILFNDITARKRAEDDVRLLNATLESRIAERTAELETAQEALRQSQKLEAMGQLTGGVAHDFNNLLTPIIGSLDLLHRRAAGSEREQRLIDGALQSAERAKTLVQRLLAFARRQPLQPRPVDVGALVEGMADLVASTSGPRTKVAVDVAPDCPAAIADPNQLEMAILNLSVNARDAMPDGGRLSITVGCDKVGAGHRSGLPGGRYVCLSVADTGVGMDADTMRRAIEPFFSTKGLGKGTGLGLSMVHGLVTQLGGAMQLSSRPGLGTRIELWLPATGAPAEADTGAPASDAALSTGRALLVDDEELVRASTAHMLGDLGYDVAETGSADEALRRLSGDEPFDLLVTDHLMPGMTGTELARMAIARRPSLPVLIISGYAELDGIAPDLPRLTKPFRQAELAEALGGLSG